MELTFISSITSKDMLCIVYRDEKKNVSLSLLKFEKYFKSNLKGEIIFLSSTFHVSTPISSNGLKYKTVDMELQYIKPVYLVNLSCVPNCSK